MVWAVMKEAVLLAEWRVMGVMWGGLRWDFTFGV
jgi:hypothetical protein